MKAITIKQPWASLIIDGLKDIENRTWKTNFRGRILIHAGSTIDSRQRDGEWFYRPFTKEQHAAIGSYDYHVEQSHVLTLPRGAIIGSVEIVDCVINHPSNWAEKTEWDHLAREAFVPKDRIIYNWVLANPVKFEKPIPAKGKLMLWNYNDEKLK